MLRPVAYGLMATAGVLLICSPALATLGNELLYAMSGFLTLGGVLSLYGSLREQWMGEFLGLPLLIPAFAVFALFMAGQAANAPLLAFANFSLLLAVAATLAARWREVKAVYRIANDGGERRGRGRK